jgi:hypothetical protein
MGSATGAVWPFSDIAARTMAQGAKAAGESGANRRRPAKLFTDAPTPIKATGTRASRLLNTTDNWVWGVAVIRRD